ncbi:Hypothetical protein R9X50_00633400 [Acrodontium crateriforme]|uniref:Uncharacterized protein n=1 Tax=Acrodontium crateriforme TaxID=150365 RepID=A0AAQ3M848_9PEZI|nr:Hypothetical protein R9X50_00633400 [Acrodontium crateriforme]
MSEESGHALEMTPSVKGEQGLNDIPELPDSVAESPLFILPREIRDRIYNFCLTTCNAFPNPFPIEWPTLPSSTVVLDLHPQLLRTCKIIHEEATPLLYTLNIMAFHHPSDANMFVRAISSPKFSNRISRISLHIKAADTRLWMPYLTSTDGTRSLKADFPNIRELGVRYRSNKWSHALTPDSNMKLWAEDSRLDEIIDGLRQVFIPPAAADPMRLGRDGKPREFTEVSFLDYIDGRHATETFRSMGHRNSTDLVGLRKEPPKSRQPAANAHVDAPTIRIICACRLHLSHFNTITGSAPMPDHMIPPQDRLGTQDHHTPPPLPVREGEPFRGFTSVDLRGPGVLKKLIDSDFGSATVARTPFADKYGILIALEVHCLDLKREVSER